MSELNKMSEQKFKRVQKSFINATDLLKAMQADLWFIHGAIKKLTLLNAVSSSLVVIS